MSANDLGNYVGKRKPGPKFNDGQPLTAADRRHQLAAAYDKGDFAAPAELRLRDRRTGLARIVEALPSANPFAPLAAARAMSGNSMSSAIFGALASVLGRKRATA